MALISALFEADFIENIVFKQHLKSLF